MARPKPTVLMTHDHGEYSEQVLHAQDMFIVVFEGKPFNIRKVFERGGVVAHKYIRTTYPAPAHAERLADRLNQVYGTTLFSVVKLGDK